MNKQMQSWYDSVLQQMAAESYLNTWSADPNSNRALLNLGTNSYQQVLQDGNTPTTPDLPGTTRLTPAQAEDFLARYSVVAHLPNTASGFSGTLLRENQSGAYTLAMRSTEYFNRSEGGDWARDGLAGADGEIGAQGFALAQIASMEAWYAHLKAGENWYDLDKKPGRAAPHWSSLTHRWKRCRCFWRCCQTTRCHAAARPAYPVNPAATGYVGAGDMAVSRPVRRRPIAAGPGY